MGNENIQKIDLRGIDWNKLTVEEFHKLSKEYDERDAALKKTKKRKSRDQKGEQPFVVHGKVYMVKNIVIEKYKKMKSEKSRQKLLNTIMMTAPLVEEI